MGFGRADARAANSGPRGTRKGCTKREIPVPNESSRSKMMWEKPSRSLKALPIFREHLHHPLGPGRRRPVGWACPAVP